jgi:hypothetical protein
MTSHNEMLNVFILVNVFMALWTMRFQVVPAAICRSSLITTVLGFCDRRRRNKCAPKRNSLWSANYAACSEPWNQVQHSEMQEVSNRSGD